MCFCLFFFFFFKQKTAYELRISDWSSDVCSSDLQFVKGADTGLALGLPRLRGLANPFQFLVNGLLTARFLALFLRHALGLRLQPRAVIALERNTAAPVELKHPAQIGKASCRERVCQYVKISVGGVH